LLYWYKITSTDAAAAVLYKRLAAGSFAGNGKRVTAVGTAAEHAKVAAGAYVDARVLSPYDGYNTLQRLLSARQHVLCGLRDVMDKLMSRLTAPDEDGRGLNTEVLSLLAQFTCLTSTNVQMLTPEALPVRTRRMRFGFYCFTYWYKCTNADA
jgi:hypothetical protein